MIIKNGNDVRNGLCLLSVFDGADVFLANVDFCDKENTIKEYKEWEKGYVRNAICLTNNSYTPQSIRRGEIDHVINRGFILDNLLDKLDLEMEDCTIPILGGFKKENFQELLNKLWDIESDEFWEYERIMREYYEEKMEKIKKNQLRTFNFAQKLPENSNFIEEDEIKAENITDAIERFIDKHNLDAWRCLTGSKYRFFSGGCTSGHCTSGHADYLIMKKEG